MHKTTKYFVLYFLLLYSIISCVGQRNNKNTNKFKSGGKFIPGKTKLSNKNSYNPRAKRPTIGDVLRSQGRGNPQRRRPGASPGGGGGYAGVDHNDADAVNRRNYLNNLKNNNKANNNNHRSTGSGNQVQYPNVGKIVPPLRRTEGENPPFAPSWTHCVISIQVSIAWVVVKSPHYPNKFQGQVQCSWIATAMEGYRVRLSFKDLDLLVPNNNGCGSQFVEVIDMDLQKSQARFCGTDLPGDYVSNGNKLRLDLQADAIATPYRGFMAAFRADKEVPGRRETSYFGQGIPAGPYNPLTQSPPSNPTNPLPLRRRITRPTTTPGIPGQKIYGARNQPRYENPEKDPEEDALDSSTTHLYIIIAVILVILVAAAAAYVFKRYFFKTFMAWRKKRKNGGEEMEMQKTEGVYGITKQTGLPGNVPLPPPPNQPPNTIATKTKRLV
uniref:uncharacterized protein LOC120339409 isoform X1 n=1 Tax=Styela clava TaxID=7725 RepID=UPI0019395204|nr:uncharacterized protein LOC120339409 isoform X1 [Styela clava]